jgi:UDP-N-acetylglucosamine--N-acetylmuramyl-(pentapeptide) pyrophosphoryl-undecaprenol N-acetylglucosamine transferase
MNVLLTGGGTGGHVYPALAVAAALAECAGKESVACLFAGPTRGDTARIAKRAGIPFAPVRAGAVRGRSAWQLVHAIWDLALGTAQGWRIVGRFRPAVVLATGGYASVPIAIAAWLRRVPLVLYLPDVHPGWAARLLAVLATRIAVTNEGALEHLPRRKTVVTGYPVRSTFFSRTRAEARRSLGLEDDLPVLLVTGASQGAQTLNRATWEALPALLPRCIILHQTGTQHVEAAERVTAALPTELRCRYHPLGYIDDMASAMAAADLAVMRAGASSLAEPPAAGLATILVPGRFAGAHQRHNAAFMAARGAAILLEEEELHRLAEVVLGLLDDRGSLERMRAAASALARPDAARAIATVLLEVAA